MQIADLQSLDTTTGFGRYGCVRSLGAPTIRPRIPFLVLNLF
jgi:hypothetical protein